MSTPNPSHHILHAPAHLTTARFTLNNSDLGARIISSNGLKYLYEKRHTYQAYMLHKAQRANLWVRKALEIDEESVRLRAEQSRNNCAHTCTTCSTPSTPSEKVQSLLATLALMTYGYFLIREIPLYVRRQETAVIQEVIRAEGVIAREAMEVFVGEKVVETLEKQRRVGFWRGCVAVVSLGLVKGW